MNKSNRNYENIRICRTFLSIYDNFIKIRNNVILILNIKIEVHCELKIGHRMIFTMLQLNMYQQLVRQVDTSGLWGIG